MDPDPRTRRAIRPDRHRRRLPGARRGVFLEEAEPLVQSRVDGPGRRIQLLSGQEPRRLRRSGCGDHERRGAGAENANASRPRPGPEVLSRHGRLQRPAGFDPGRHSAGQAEASPGVDRGAPRGCGPLPGIVRGQRMQRLRLPYEPEWSKAVYHLFVVQGRRTGKSS